LVQAEDIDVRWRDDGTAPTADVGELIYVQGDHWIEGAVRLAAFRAIEVSTGAILNASYYA
jgi:hypothetical protein